MQPETFPSETPRESSIPAPVGVSIKHVFAGTTTSSGMPISLPAGRVEATVSEYRIPANSTLPEHRHQYPRYGYVLAGSIAVTDVETGTVRKFNPGSFIVEDVDRWHTAHSVGPVPVVLVVIDLAPVGKSTVDLREVSKLPAKP